MEIKAEVNAVLVSRILAGLIIILSLAYSTKTATDALSDGFWCSSRRRHGALGPGCCGHYRHRDSAGN